MIFKQRRLAEGFSTQISLAIASQVPAKRIGRLERGEGRITVDEASRIAPLLHMQTVELLRAHRDQYPLMRVVKSVFLLSRDAVIQGDVNIASAIPGHAKDQGCHIVGLHSAVKFASICCRALEHVEPVRTCKDADYVLCETADVDYIIDMAHSVGISVFHLFTASVWDSEACRFEEKVERQSLYPASKRNARRSSHTVPFIHAPNTAHLH
jgi:hypothetical protein